MEKESVLIPSPRFGRFMTRDGFESLMRSIEFREGNANQQNEWHRINMFVQAFNDCRESRYTPSHHICVDESISRWYGLGGSWCNEGLPHYVAIERKPENGCELKTASCGESGIMIRLEVTKEKELQEEMVFDDCCEHSTSMTLRLAQPWIESNGVFCADSWF